MRNKRYITNIIDITQKEIMSNNEEVNNNINQELSLNKVFVIKGTANSGNKDRFSEIMPKSCWDLENYKKNPILLYNHDYTKPLGRITELYATDAGLKFTAEIGHIDSAMTELQEDTVKLIQQGILKMFSVGFIGHDYDYDKQNETYIYTRAELLEISVVAVPMDADASIENFYQKSIKEKTQMDEILKEVQGIKEQLASFANLSEENSKLRAEIEAKNTEIAELRSTLADANELL